MITIWVTSGVLTFAATFAFRAKQSEQPNTAEGSLASLDPHASVDVTSTAHGTSRMITTSLMAPERIAKKIPPQDMQNCQQYSTWAQQNGALPAGGNPVHSLSIKAKREVLVEVQDLIAIQVAPINLATKEENWVALHCHDTVSNSPTPPSSADGAPNIESDFSEIELMPPSAQADEDFLASNGEFLGLGGRLHSLEAGEQLNAVFDFDSFMAYKWEEMGYLEQPFSYYLTIGLVVDGVPKIRTIKNGDLLYACCGEMGIRGFEPAQYKWTLPARTLTYCKELRWTTHEPPLPTCGPRAPD
ncbi:hypothetical protein [Micromonospora pallida]|uniref:hypothetical protein n=1 Tax=Micromonospora pallida TaxID=145854 RepID=UPI00114CC5D2|nr:hypothetical protein [Micromonospora pallida]